jgi:hypothetical protein
VQMARSQSLGLPVTSLGNALAIGASASVSPRTPAPAVVFIVVLQSSRPRNTAILGLNTAGRKDVDHLLCGKAVGEELIYRSGQAAGWPSGCAEADRLTRLSKPSALSWSTIEAVARCHSPEQPMSGVTLRSLQDLFR